eukprot:2706554-Rhodomonas_salina.1
MQPCLYQHHDTTQDWYPQHGCRHADQSTSSTSLCRSPNSDAKQQTRYKGCAGVMVTEHKP